MDNYIARESIDFNSDEDNRVGEQDWSSWQEVAYLYSSTHSETDETKFVVHKDYHGFHGDHMNRPRGKTSSGIEFEAPTTGGVFELALQLEGGEPFTVFCGSSNNLDKKITDHMYSGPGTVVYNLEDIVNSNNVRIAHANIMVWARWIITNDTLHVERALLREYDYILNSSPNGERRDDALLTYLCQNDSLA